MAAAKEGSRSRSRGSTEAGKRGRSRRMLEEDTPLPRGAALVDVDPWSAFFETFWDQMEGGPVDDGHDGARVSDQDTRRPGTRPRR